MVFNVVSHLLLLGHYRDTQCGLKAFRRDVARSIFGRTRIDGFAFDVEVLHLAERDHLRLAEVPVVLSPTDDTTVRIGRAARRMMRDVLAVRRWSAQGLYDVDVEPAGRSDPAATADHTRAVTTEAAPPRQDRR